MSTRKGQKSVGCRFGQNVGINWKNSHKQVTWALWASVYSSVKWDLGSRSHKSLPALNGQRKVCGNSVSTCTTFKVLHFRQDSNIPHLSRLPFCAPYPILSAVCAQTWFCQPRTTNPAAFLPRSLRAFLPLDSPTPAPQVLFSFPHTLCFLWAFAHAVLTACLDLSSLTVQWPYYPASVCLSPLRTDVFAPLCIPIS